MKEDKKKDSKVNGEAVVDSSNDVHVTQHLDRDPNDPRNVEPTPVLPSLDDPKMQGPEHGRVSNDNDFSEEGQHGPKI